MAKSVATVWVPVDDMKRALEFYSTTLNLDVKDTGEDWSEIDAGNLMIEGYEDHRIALDLLGPYLAGVHLKNVAFDRPPGGGVWRPRWSPLDDGVVDVAGLLAALDAVDFDGWVSLEDFSDDRSPADTAHHNAAVLARLSVGTPS